MKLFKNRARLYLSCHYSCRLYLLVKIKEVNLKNLHTSKVFLYWRDGGSLPLPKAESLLIFPSPHIEKFEDQRIWIWNLDQNLIMALLVVAICSVPFKKLAREEICNFSFKMFEMRFSRFWKCLSTTWSSLEQTVELTQK